MKERDCLTLSYPFAPTRTAPRHPALPLPAGALTFRPLKESKQKKKKKSSFSSVVLFAFLDEKKNEEKNGEKTKAKNKNSPPGTLVTHVAGPRLDARVWRRRRVARTVQPGPAQQGAQRRAAVFRARGELRGEQRLRVRRFRPRPPDRAGAALLFFPVGDALFVSGGEIWRERKRGGGM